MLSRESVLVAAAIESFQCHSGMTPAEPLSTSTRFLARIQRIPRSTLDASLAEVAEVVS
jgi:hypothetical protein